jgi:predicted transglutaminase-like cysteine proteinase
MRVLVLLFVVFWTTTVYGQKGPSMPMYGYTKPPIGWIDLCRREPEPCEMPEYKAKQVDLSDMVWHVLHAVNIFVNTGIEPLADAVHWKKQGLTERWDYAEDGMGDCEEYVLVKQRELLRRGFPRSSLPFTIVLDAEGAGHAVLTVVTDRGDYILDNQTMNILLWHETGHHFIKRQSQEHPNRWVSLWRSGLSRKK